MAGRGSNLSTSQQAISAAPPQKKEKGLQNDLVKMVYGYGDEKQPMQESIDLLDSLVKEYLEEMCLQVNYMGCEGGEEGCDMYEAVPVWPVDDRHTCLPAYFVSMWWLTDGAVVAIPHGSLVMG